MAQEAALAALGHASSGSAGTAISTAALYPLDLITTRLKAQRQLDIHSRYDGIIDALKEIFHKEGAVALYSGLGTDVTKSIIDSFLFFGFYNYLRRHRTTPPRILQELALGALAGACSRALTTPISNVVARKQTSDSNKSLAQILNDMYSESGLSGLWSGYSATLVLTLNPSITFFVNGRLAKKVIPALEEEDVPVAWAAFLLAAISKATATAVTYPFQTGKTRLQIASSSESSIDEKCLPEGSRDSYRSVSGRFLRFWRGTIFGVIIRVLQREGVRALYDGLRAELLKSFFSHGLTMFTKGLLHRLIVHLWLTQGAQLRKRLGK